MGQLSELAKMQGIERVSDEQAATTGRLIWQTWCSGGVLEKIPRQHRPDTIEQGYAAQHALEAVGGEAVVGWKIAATSAAGQAHIAVPGPIAGRLFASRVHRSPATVAMGTNRMAVAEAEFAFVIGETLSPRATPYRVEEVMAAVSSVHPAIELPDSRFTDFTKVGSAQLAADNACANEFVLGPAAPGGAWRDLDLSQHEVRLQRNGELVSSGQGRDCLGDPRVALTWLVNCPALAESGLREGAIVTTGVCGQPTPIVNGDRIQVDFGILGEASVTLS
ncbi:MAG: 2-keto-4-pentenoate hydratase [Gammaproteobacteria bacterium]|jgi:2-keto-4-pentenoate hydratase